MTLQLIDVKIERENRQNGNEKGCKETRKEGRQEDRQEEVVWAQAKTLGDAKASPEVFCGHITSIPHTLRTRIFTGSIDDGSNRCERRDGRCLRAQNRGAKRSGLPSGIVEETQFVFRPSTFRPHGERN